MRILTVITLIIVTITIFSGCTSNNPQGRVAVQGEVTLDGKPLAEGNIEFASLPGISPAAATGAVIKNGTFSIPAEFGLIPGQEYLVRFTAQEEIPGTRKKTDDPLIPDTFDVRNLIPPKWGAESKETVKATNDSPNKFRFGLANE
ncbi:MAG: hypothetical protein LBH00_06335 [Planctomycetaceae bacterium]|jgi:hypothetical protein|nr:hypothetical protein [Planctomycetaceae bacterium]